MLFRHCSRHPPKLGQVPPSVRMEVCLLTKGLTRPFWPVGKKAPSLVLQGLLLLGEIEVHILSPLACIKAALTRGLRWIKKLTLQSPPAEPFTWCPAFAKLVRKAITGFNKRLDANGVDQRKNAAGISGKANPQHGSNIPFSGVLNDPLLHTTGSHKRLDIEQSQLESINVHVAFKWQIHFADSIPGVALTVHIVIEPGAVPAAFAIKRLDKGFLHLVTRRFYPSIREVFPLLVHCVVPDLNRKLIGHRKRSDGKTGLSGHVINQRRRVPLRKHAHTLLQIGTDHTSGEKTTGVVDENRRLTKLLHKIKCMSQASLRCLLAADYLNQGHTIHRREEVQTDKTAGMIDTFR